MIIDGKLMTIIGHDQSGIWFFDSEECCDIYIDFIDLPKHANIHPVCVIN